ncbi:MAG TPA: hypothetical protein VE776_07615 [Actinomycetota bacterium]|nr:hypothetical protein [Actinomycetota bacterium]
MLDLPSRSPGARSAPAANWRSRGDPGGRRRPVDLLSQTRAFFHTAGDPSYAIARDHNGRLTGAFAMRALDTTVIIDTGGRVVYRDEVPTDLATLTRALSKAGLA